MRVVAVVVFAMFLIGSAGLAQDASKSGPRRPGTPGASGEPQPLSAGRTFASEVYVGDRAPDFILDEPSGRKTKLSAFRGAWLVLAFADRGADVAHLRSIETELSSMGSQLVAVCHEKSQSLRTVVQRDSIGFTVLADVTGEIAARYGLYDKMLRRTTPGYFVVDRGGVVRLAVLGQGLPASDVAGFARYAIQGI